MLSSTMEYFLLTKCLFGKTTTTYTIKLGAIVVVISLLQEFIKIIYQILIFLVFFINLRNIFC